jgi:hypothetical protein
MTLRALVPSDIPNIAESEVTNLVTDLAAKVPTSTTVNGHALSSNIVSVADLGLVGTAGLVIDGGGSTPTTGSKGFLQVTFAGTITGWTLIADQSLRGSPLIPASSPLRLQHSAVSRIQPAQPSPDGRRPLRLGMFLSSS